jgi:transposase
MGGISKQGNRLLRFLMVESANIAVRFDPVAPRISTPLPSETLHRAKVAAARKLATRMYRILPTQTPYPQVLSSRAA